MAVHAFVSWPHYADHIAPIWQQIPEKHRGQFVVGSHSQRSRMRARGIEAVLPRQAGLTARAMQSKGPIIVASFSDLQKMGKRPAVFVEHGAGQTYVLDDGRIHGGYSGGVGRSSVGLFICPNRMVMQANRKEYPDASFAVVGSPRLDDLWEARNVSEGPDRETLAISFHWECRVVREAGSAFSEFRDAIPPFVRRLQNYGIDVVGHGHPKAFSDLKPWWQSQGVKVEAEWEHVVEIADAYMVDNSSTIFEAAALDIPILLMESKRWRREVYHGMRFWDHSNVGPSVTPESDLDAAFAESLSDKWSSVREQVARTVYEIPPSVDRLSSRYAADAIVDWLGQ